MNKWKLYRLIQQQSNLKDERHPMFEKNRFMKFLAVFMFLYYAAILVLMGCVMPMGMSHAYNGVAAFHVLDGYFPVLLMIDFWIRFGLQETPAQQGKPYTLLPIRQSFLMNVYLVRSGFSLGNMYWFFLLVPFGLIAIVSHFGWWAFFGWLLGWWMMCIANGFAYLFIRALCMKHIAWCLLPAAIHGAIIALMTVPDKNPLDMPCTEFLYGFSLWHVLPILSVALIIALLYWANYKLQRAMVYNEVGKKEEVEMKTTTQMNFLNRYGRLGEYLKLEMKLRLRNKQVRMQFFVVLGAMLLLSGLLDLTDVYDNGFMTSFICLYDYICPGMTTLVTIMCFEGNYMDGLMSRRESIYELLRAKYYFNVGLLFIPFLLVIPSIFLGKITIWMSMGYLFMTAGLLYPILFQMAVYNRDTINLNQKMTGKQANTTQNILAMAAVFMPIGLDKVLVLAFGQVWGFVVMMALGCVGIATHKLWLRNIYNRMMLRRHHLLEGYRASRNS